MRTSSPVVASILSLFLFFGASSAFAQRNSHVAPADILIIRAKVFTADEKQPWADTIAIRQGKIAAVGTELVVGRLRGIGTKVIDAGGRLVLPGFTDCHIHFMDGSLSLGRVNLEGAKNPADIQKRLRAYASQHPGDGWILGRGWDYAMFAPANLPDKKYLDGIFLNRPVFLEGYDGHTYWANSKALSLAGITKDTPDPPNGVIVRDPQSKEPTGALKESAQDIVARIIPKPSRVEKLQALRAGIKWANQNGITRVHSAGGDFEQLALLDELRQTRQLTLRFYIAYFLNPPELRKEDLNAIEDAHKKYHDEWIDVSAVKFMIDGVIESHTAAMLEPYTDQPSTKGSLFWDPEKYKAAVAELDKRNLQLFTHAIGDYAIRTSLDTYEFALNKNHSKDHRPRIEHIESISAADIPRFGKLGVIASMQPLHSYPDDDTLNVWASNIGPDRASRAWVWKSIAETGGRYAFGSDWPVVTLDPWKGMQTAVTRQTSDGKPGGGFIASQRLTVSQAIEGYTSGAAYAGRREKTEGSIEAGKVADIIILNQNLFDIDPQHIDTTKVVTTIVGGKIVYEADK
ncbi:MAG TPA: amidohydrolase [Candidatus Acidoferrum sp.]